MESMGRMLDRALDWADALSVSARRWFDPVWWSYLRVQYPDRFVVLGACLGLALGIGGYASASTLVSSGNSATGYVTTRVVRTVRVLRPGRTSTLLERHSVSTSVRTRTESQRVARYRSVYRNRLVVVHGKPVTVSKVVIRRRTRTVAQPRTLTITVTGPARTATNTVTTTVTVTTRPGH
jgi:hypothetical protein